jgi:hypothetical protein
LEDLRIDERIILKWILKRNIVGKCGLDLSTNKWLDNVNTVMKIRDCTERFSWIHETLLACKLWLCFVDLVTWMCYCNGVSV